MDKEEGTRNPEGGSQFPMEIPKREVLLGQELSGSSDINQQPRTRSTALKNAKLKKTEVMKRVYEMQRLRSAWHQVKRNAGAAGIDGMTIQEFDGRKEELLVLIHERLKEGKYRFKPARRVLIPKLCSTKMRKLGIPVVMDRVVSESVHLVLEEIFHSQFTKSNFGFLRGRSQHQAIEHVRRQVQEGYVHCAAIDLQSFFDEIPHPLIFKLIRDNIEDESFVTLIARALKAGVIIDGEFHKTNKGVPQGSPLSPTISNIVLNELDHELERRGLRYCRWADDFIILVKSPRAAERVKTNTARYLESKLGLKVNQEKTQVNHINRVEFLGFQMHGGRIRVSNRAKTKLKDKVRRLTKRNNPLSMYQITQDLNEYLRGWVGYFRVQEFKMIFQDLDRWIRSRLRSMQLKKWKKPRKFQKVLITHGYHPNKARRIWVNMRRWHSVMRPEVKYVLSLEWYRRRGLLFLDDFTQRELELPFCR